MRQDRLLSIIRGLPKRCLASMTLSHLDFKTLEIMRPR